MIFSTIGSRPYSLAKDKFNRTNNQIPFYSATKKPGLSTDTVAFGKSTVEFNITEIKRKLRDPNFVDSLDTAPSNEKLIEFLNKPENQLILQDPAILKAFIEVGQKRFHRHIEETGEPKAIENIIGNDQAFNNLKSVLDKMSTPQTTSFAGWLTGNKTTIGKAANKVNQNSVLSSAIAVLTSQIPPIIPIDQANVGLSLADMARKMAKLYEIPIDKHLASHIAAISSFAVACSVGDSFIQWIPIIGNVSNAVATFSINQAAGWALIALFEAASKDPESFNDLISDNYKTYVNAGNDLLKKWKAGEIK